MASKKKSQETASQPAPSASNKYLMYVGIAIAALVVFWITSSYSKDDSAYQETSIDTQEQQEQTQTETQQVAVEYVSLQPITWPADTKTKCKTCMNSPTGCVDQTQSVAYKCDLPTGLPADGTWSCSREIKGISSTKGTCSTAYDNYIRVRPDQASDISICCSYSYVDAATGVTKKSQEYCKTREVPVAC